MPYLVTSRFFFFFLLLFESWPTRETGLRTIPNYDCPLPLTDVPVRLVPTFASDYCYLTMFLLDFFPPPTTID